MARSRFDSDAGIVCYREAQCDYRMVKNDEVALLDYLATLVAKEYVIYNAARSTPTGRLQVPGLAHRRS